MNHYFYDGGDLQSAMETGYSSGLVILSIVVACLAAYAAMSVAGRIRDRQGNLHPGYKVRCGERIIIADHPNDSPRRIVDTSYTAGGGGRLEISTDSATRRLEGLFDRIETARQAANLT